MKITVITVCFNSAATISDALDSVALQTHPDVEHIVIDGGSTDGTQAIVRSRGSNIAKFVSEADHGIYDAMNKGLRLATGDMVGFLNADDVFATPSALSLVEAAAKQSVDAVYGDLVYVRSDDLSAVIRHWHSGAYVRARLRRGWMPPHPTFYVRRARLEQIGLFDSRLRIAADYDFMLRCLILPRFVVAYVPQVLVRMRAGGVSNRSITALLNKSREDLTALRKSGVGGVWTLACKNLRKLPQFLRRN